MPLSRPFLERGDYVLAVSEEDLIEQCRKGDASAFEQIVALYEKRVYNLAYRLTGNHDDAQDMAQEAFVKVWASLKEFRGDSSFSTWLYRIVSNACLDELRRRSRRRTVSLDAPVGDEGPARQVPSDEPELGYGMERDEVRRAVQQGIRGLSDHHKMIIVLRDIQGMSYEQIAEALDISLGTVKSRLNRARLSLRDRLSEMELFEEMSVRTGERGDRR